MSGYDFSPLYHAAHLAFSPGSTFLATAHEKRVIIRSTNNLAIVRAWHLASLAPSDLVSSVQWSDDGLYILVFSRSAGVAWVLGLGAVGEGEDGEVAKIMGGGVEGLERVEWAKGGREVLAWGEHGLKLLIYTLSTGQTSAIQDPKASTGCHKYSPDHRYLAVAERHSGKESVGLYDTADGYALVRNFSLQASDVQNISWSPCGRFIAVVDSHLSYSVYIHSPIGPLLTHFSHLSPTYSPTPSALSTTPSGPSSAATIIHEDPGLGIRHLEWVPGGQYLLLLGWDGKVRVLEAEEWRCMAVLNGGMPKVGKNVTVWREPEGWIKDTRGRGIVQFDQTPFNSPLTSPTSSAVGAYSTPSSPLPLSISPSGRHFLLLPPNQPTVMHIYTLIPAPGAAPSIKHKAAVVFSRNIRSARWASGGKERVGVVCRSSGGKGQAGTALGGGGVYIWDEEGWENEGETNGEEGGARGGVMEGVGIPNGAGFHMNGLQFSPDGTTLALQSKGEFCLMYDTEDDAEDVKGGAKAGDDGAQKGWETEGLSFVREEEEEDDGR